MAREYSGRLNLLLTDVVVPQVNGRDLARDLLSRHPGLKRLFVSGCAANVIARHGVPNQEVHFPQKPFSSAKLAARVRAALDG